MATPKDKLVSTWTAIGTGAGDATATLDVSADAPAWARFIVVNWLISSSSGTLVESVLTHATIEYVDIQSSPAQISDLNLVLPISGGDLTWFCDGTTLSRCSMGGFWI